MTIGAVLGSRSWIDFDVTHTATSDRLKTRRCDEERTMHVYWFWETIDERTARGRFMYCDQVLVICSINACKQDDKPCKVSQCVPGACVKLITTTTTYYSLVYITPRQLLFDVLLDQMGFGGRTWKCVATHPWLQAPAVATCKACKGDACTCMHARF